MFGNLFSLDFVLEIYLILENASNMVSLCRLLDVHVLFMVYVYTFIGKRAKLQ